MGPLGVLWWSVGGPSRGSVGGPLGGPLGEPSESIRGPSGVCQGSVGVRRGSVGGVSGVHLGLRLINASDRFMTDS